jgi:hypothetical protein
MKERYIPAFVMLIAAAITSVINIVNKVEVMAGLKRLLLVIVIFYIIGLIVKAIIKKALTKKPVEPEEIEETDEIKEPQDTKEPQSFTE